uniref:Uncharacterized protein n=1 Tax=uncultured bacterium contig00046 TaxID=1181532 RepID=A0A806KMU6_9BACT|nr:hypothetical protein [uncultured bacterium contig00046]
MHKLEDNNEIRGWLVNFDLESSKLSDRIKAFQDVWSGEVKDSFIVRALLVYGDYKVCTRENTALGKMHYFGGKEGWYRILTEKNEDRKNILENFLDAFNEIKEGDINDKLQKLIDNYKFENKDWKYYFIKYSAITEEYNGFPCLYFWRGNGFEIERLRKDSPKPSVAKHINPYLIALKEKIDSERVKLYEERYDRPSYLSIDDGELKIYCKENGWQIEKNGSSSPENVPKDEDRIQFAAKIIKSKLTLKDYVPSSA